MSAPGRVAIGMGSNLGPRTSHLRAGARALEGMLEATRFSSVYETEPVDLVEQPPFLNACCVGRTRLDPHALLDRLKAAEADAGRRPGTRFGPRVLDLDILLYGDEVVLTDRLEVPHPRLTERAFALVPLAEIAGDWIHPGCGVSIARLAERADRSGVEATNLQVRPGGA